MDRCTEIQRLIMTDWQKTNSFNYIVKATDSLNGFSRLDSGSI